MKSFHLYPDNINFKKPNFKKLLKGFRIFKKPVFLSVCLSLIIAVIAGTLSSIYLAPVVKDKLYLSSSNQKEEMNPDLFLESSGSVDSNKNKKEEAKEATAKQPKSIADVVEEVSPAVVSIIVSKYVPVIEEYYINPFEEFERFFGRDFGFKVPQYREKGRELQQIGGGTGFIVSPDGLIVTNKHVVYDESAEYTVLMNDGTKYPAPVLARDPVQDIAILKISAHNLPTVKLGNSDNLRIGQTVIAIGNALGEFRNTVSVGVISGLSRTITASGGGIIEQLEEVIQTDAAINEGNSGGPLLNIYGEVIGINTAMAQGAENIGFAIPINKAKKVITDIQTKGRIVYPFLGVRYILITKSIAQKNNLPVDYGALIVRGNEPGEVAVIPGSAADKAGLRENDIILEIDGQKITPENSLSKLILKHDVGDRIVLKILRQGEEKIIDAVLEEWGQ